MLIMLNIMVMVEFDWSSFEFKFNCQIQNPNSF